MRAVESSLPFSIFIVEELSTVTPVEEAVSSTETGKPDNGAGMVIGTGVCGETDTPPTGIIFCAVCPEYACDKSSEPVEAACPESSGVGFIVEAPAEDNGSLLKESCAIELDSADAT